MPRFDPDELARWTGGHWTSRPTTDSFSFTVDSRRLSPGQVFVALKTEKRDGHDFLGAAKRNGAAAALVATPDQTLDLAQLVVADPLAALQTIAREHRKLFKGPVIGISGSAGKTSTKNLLAHLLGGKALVLATEGNLNNHIGVPLTLTRLEPGTHAYAVVEAGISAKGEMKPLADMIEPDLALVTFVGPAHLADLGGLDGVAAEKALLPAAIRPAGIAIFPGECTRFPAFRELSVKTMIVEPAEVLRPAHPANDRVYFALSQRGDSTSIALAYGAPPPLLFTLRRISDGMARNAALAICAALWLGIPAKQIQARIAAWEPAPLRGEWRSGDGRKLYLDCYNANPASMADALEMFHAVSSAADPRLFILGCMEELGPDTGRYHRELGANLRLRPGDAAFLIGAQAQAIRDGAVGSGAAPSQLHITDSIEEVALAVSSFRGSVFVKGSRKYQLERAIEGAAMENAHA